MVQISGELEVFVEWIDGVLKYRGYRDRMILGLLSQRAFDYFLVFRVATDFDLPYEKQISDAGFQKIHSIINNNAELKNVSVKFSKTIRSRSSELFPHS